MLKPPTGQQWETSSPMIEIRTKKSYMKPHKQQEDLPNLQNQYYNTMISGLTFVVQSRANHCTEPITYLTEKWFKVARMQQRICQVKGQLLTKQYSIEEF